MFFAMSESLRFSMKDELKMFSTLIPIAVPKAVIKESIIEIILFININSVV